ncbi:hypothetical protein B4168_2589 [Anoxybacillus flavithermus]|nr:hypothetical protein B4168_2589 [Anoxybacillus flavithermus]
MFHPPRLYLTYEELKRCHNRRDGLHRPSLYLTYEELKLK